MIVQKCTAKFPFEARSEKELSFKEGDVIVVQTKMNSGWWIGELDGNVGLFPVNYTEIGEEEQESWYKPIKLRTQPSRSIADLQKQCGLISEKKELTKLQRQKISSKITDLQNKMQETINRSLAAQQATSTGHSAAPAPPSNTSESGSSDGGEAGEGDTLVTVLKARPSGPRGRRAMSRGHLSTLKRGPTATGLVQHDATASTESKGAGEEERPVVAAKDQLVSSVGSSNVSEPTSAVTVSESEQKKSGEQPEAEMGTREGGGASAGAADTGDSKSEEKKKKKSKKKKADIKADIEDTNDTEDTKKKKKSSSKSKADSEPVEESPADKDEAKSKKKTKKVKGEAEDEKEKEKRKSKRKSRVVLDDVVSAEEARKAVRQQQQESSRSKHKRSPSTSTLVGLSEGKEKRTEGDKKEEKKLRRTVSIQDVGDQMVEDESASDKKKSKTKEIRELTRKLRAESKLRTTLQDSTLELQKEITELRAANARLIEQKKAASSSEQVAGADAVSRLEGEKAVLEAEALALSGEAKELREKAREEEDRAKLAEGELAAVSKEMKKLSASHATEVESLKNKLKSAETLATQKAKKASSLRKEVGELSTRTSDLEESLASKSRELSSASESLTSLTAKNKELNLDCSKLRDSIQRMTAEQAIGAKSMQLLTKKIEALEEDRDRAREEKSSVEKDLAEARARVSALEEDSKASAAAAAATAAGALAAAELKCKGLGVTIAAKEELVEELRAKLAKAADSADAERVGFEQQLADSSEQCQSFEAAEKKASGELSIATAELDQLRSSNAKLSEKADRLSSQLRSTQESFDAKVGELESTLAQESAARQASDRQIGVLRQEAAGERSAVESEAELQINELRSQLATSRAQAEDLSAKLAAERSRIAAMEGDHEKEREQLEAEHADALSLASTKHEEVLAAVRTQLSDQLESKEGDLSSEREAQKVLRVELKSSEALVADLKEAVREITQSLRAAESASEESERAAAAAKKELAAASMQATAAESLAREHEVAATAAVAQVKELLEQIRRSQEEHSSKLVEKERELAAQFSQESSVEVQQLRAEVLDLKQAANDTARQLEGSKDDAASLQQKLERERAAHATRLEEEKTELSAQHALEIERLSSQVAEKEAASKSAADGYEIELATITTALEEARANVSSLKTQLVAAEEECRSTTRELDQLTKEAVTTQREGDDTDALREENQQLHARIGELQQSVQQYKTATAKHEKKAAANRRRFDELVDLQKDVQSLEKELESKEAKIVRLKAEHSLTVASMQAQIEELGRAGKEQPKAKAAPIRAEGESLHREVDELQAKLQAATQKLEAEKAIRDQLQTRLRAAETNLSTLQRSVREGEAETSRQQASRLEELSSTPASTKAVKRLVEQKHLLEDKVLALTKKLSQQEDAQAELELAFSDRLNSLISTIEEENDKRAHAEGKHKKTLIRLDEAELKLIEEAQAKRELECRVGELSAIRVKLEQELLDEAEVQNSLKEAFALKLDEFCQTLDQMYDNQMGAQGDKDDMAAVVESLEGKILEETKARMAVQAELRDEIAVRQELENSFIEKLEKLSLLVMQEANVSSYDDLQND